MKDTYYQHKNSNLYSIIAESRTKLDNTWKDSITYIDHKDRIFNRLKENFFSGGFTEFKRNPPVSLHIEKRKFYEEVSLNENIYMLPKKVCRTLSMFKKNRYLTISMGREPWSHKIECIGVSEDGDVIFKVTHKLLGFIPISANFELNVRSRQIVKIFELLGYKNGDSYSFAWHFEKNPIFFA